MWKEREIVTINDKRYQIVKRKTKTGSICEECRQANRDAQLLLTWYERSECIMGGTICHCNMNYDCYPKLLMEYFPETSPIKVDMSESTEYDVQLVESHRHNGSK